MDPVVFSLVALIIVIFFTTQKSTSKGRREDERWYSNGRRQRWQMTTVADNEDTQDWVADCNGEGGEQAARAGSERRRRQRSGNDGCGRGRWQQRTMTAKVSMIAADDNGMQDRAADYDGSGRQEKGKRAEW